MDSSGARCRGGEVRPSCATSATGAARSELGTPRGRTLGSEREDGLRGLPSAGTRNEHVECGEKPLSDVLLARSPPLFLAVGIHLVSSSAVEAEQGGIELAEHGERLTCLER